MLHRKTVYLGDNYMPRLCVKALIQAAGGM